MKTTTTLFEIVKSELLLSGQNEFENFKDVETSGGNKNVFQITGNDDDFSFIKKMTFFDDDVEKIVTLKFFNKQKISDSDIDRQFKSAFLKRFLDREISRQTMEAFSSQVTYCFINRMDYIYFMYAHMNDLLKSSSLSETEGTNSNITDNRSAETNMPQDKVNLNVDNTLLDYANLNTINRNKGTGNTTGNTKTDNFNKSVQELAGLRQAIDDIFNDFDKACFLQIW